MHVKNGKRMMAMLVAMCGGIWVQGVFGCCRSFAAFPRFGKTLGDSPKRDYQLYTLHSVAPPFPQPSISCIRSTNVAGFAVLAAAVAGAIYNRFGRHHCRAHQTVPHGSRVSTCRAAEGAAAASMPILKLGTRGSPLALAQAYEAKKRLAEAFPELVPDEAVEIRIISTTGDQRLEISLAEIGGKGLFTRELDVALVSKEVDFCVHSTKDVPTQLIPDTEICTFLPREDTRDVLISGDGKTTKIEDFPKGSVIGTASLRRQAQIYAKNQGVTCVNFRGNVQTRLRKLKAGDVSATLLAYAGLKRMSMEEHATTVLEWDQMLPAISQGAICFQCRSDDEKTLGYLKSLSHEPTRQAVTCERAFLAALDGNCKTPIAGQAKIVDGQLKFTGLVSSPDGQQNFRIERSGAPEDGETIGREAGEHIRKEAGEKFFEEMQSYVQQVQAANTKPTKA
jgi:hydroxymethylbilane synthase